MDSENLEELRKKFIVDQTEYEKEKLESHLEKVLKYGRITTDGKVILKNNLTNKEKVGVVLIIRYLANQLDQNISKEVSVKEISNYTGMKENQTRARCSDLVGEGVILKVEGNVFRFYPTLIDEFLNKIK
ncbi:MAG: hypothetical protein ACTSQ8_25550 [Candidatus Helarchaeota archaeon]